MVKTAKKPTLAEVLDVLEKIYGQGATTGDDDDPLIDHLLVAVLMPHCGEAKARAAVRAASEAFLDFNDLRVSPLSQIEVMLEPFVAADVRRKAAYDFRMALQDVYDNTHGLDLEPLRDRTPEAQRKFCKHLPNIHGGAASLVFQVALGDGTLALGPSEEHLLTRLGLLPRAANRPRQRAALERHVKAPDRRRFAWLAGAGAHLYEKDFDPNHPFCDLLVRAKAKELTIREQERKRDEVRRKAEEKKRQQEAERARKAAEREAQKKARDDAKRKLIAERERKKAEAKEKQRAVEQARKDAIVARKKAADDKRAADKKKAADQKAAAKKQAEKEKAERKLAEKKLAEKKKAEQKQAAKKAADNKKAEQKQAAKKAAEKPAAKKSAKKSVEKKPAEKKPAEKKPAEKKPAEKKPAEKKKVAAKKAPAKRPARRTATGRKHR